MLFTRKSVQRYYKKCTYARILRKKCIFKCKILVYGLHNATVASGECTSCRRRPKVLQCRFMQGRSPISFINAPRILRKKFIFSCNFPVSLLCRYHIFRKMFDMQIGMLEKNIRFKLLANVLWFLAKMCYIIQFNCDRTADRIGYSQRSK